MTENLTKVSARLWGLGNTTIRNPERLPGALKIFQMFFDGKKTFDTKQQGEFMKKLLEYTSEGKKITKANEIPIAEYESTIKLDRLQRDGRQWLSLMDKYGLINAYNDKKFYEDVTRKGKTYITDLGKTFLKYEELRNEIWLRQVLKIQLPHYKEQLDGYLIRGGWWFLKLIIECDGLTKEELAMASLNRTEKLVSVKKMILDYRKKYEKAGKTGDITVLDEEIEEQNVIWWYKDDFEWRVKNLKKVVEDVKNKNIQLVEVDSQNENGTNGALRSKKERIVGLGKGPNTPRALECARDITELLKKKDYDIEKYVSIFSDYYRLVKKCTIYGDYIDSNPRILIMTGYLNWHMIKGESRRRLKILDYYYDMIKDAVNNLPCVTEIEKNNVKKREEYYNYLVNVSKPRLQIDDNEFVEKKIQEMIKKLKKLGKSEPVYKKNKNIHDNYFRYNQLFTELKSVQEENFVKNQIPKEIEKEIREMINEPTKINPITLESVIWRAIGHLGGFERGIVNTRNFGLDSKFNQIFTAGGGVPDMQFHYKEFDEVVEVTKMKGKDQMKGEFKEKGAVLDHVAEHKFYNEKATNCIFIAPSIWSDVKHECWSYSCNNAIRIIRGNNNVKKDTKIFFHIIPLTLEQFLKIFLICVHNTNSSRKWIETISGIHKITNNDELEWMKDIEKYINNLKI